MRVRIHASRWLQQSLLIGLIVLPACAEAPALDQSLITSEDSSSSSDAQTQTAPDAGAVTDTPSDDDDDDDSDGTGSTAPRDAGSPRGAVNSGGDAGGARDAGTADSGSTSAVKDAGSATPPPRADSGTTAPRDAGSTPSTPVDAGSSPSGTDAGSVADAGSGGAQCSTTPAYSTADACSQCICAQCSSQVASCFASGDTTKDQQCAQVQACAEQNHCASQDCYCGANSDPLCLLPAGACVQIIQTATGSTSSLDVLNASNDTSTAVGRANAVGVCALNACRQECGF